MPKYLLEIAVFLCGAVVMIFELIGSRILGPYFGNSIFVWTSLIGIILGSLSLGYYFGGKISDKNPNLQNFSLIIFISAIFIGITTLIKDNLMSILEQNLTDLKISSVISSTILFAPASLLLGMISPYAAKLKINSLNNSGSTIGNLYAISTAGSIVGTFISGFYLIPKFGTNKLLIILILTLTLTSLLTSKKFLKIKFFTLMSSIFIWAIINQLQIIAQRNNFIDIDTTYNRVFIFDKFQKDTGKTIRTLAINRDLNSAIVLGSEEILYNYIKFYHLAKFLNPNFQNTLMLGGGGFSFPKNFLATYPKATMDVVEIDPTIIELAKKYFNLKSDPRLNIYDEDGRIFLNKNQKKYDVIFGDAFGSHFSIPYQLTTKEAVQKEFDALTDNGSVILNIISAINGPKGEFLRAEVATYKSIFPQVYIFPVSENKNGEIVQNIILVATKSSKLNDFHGLKFDNIRFADYLWKQIIPNDMPILTDDYSPVEYYINKAA
jgi:predicted membrane-bound spermidine synthase